MGAKTDEMQKKSNKVQNNVIKAARETVFYLNTDYKMFFRLFVSEENESH
jgi:hypothetical protein